MTKKTKEQTPRWLVYLIPLISGIAFSVTIFFVVWNKSLHSNKQIFLLETVSFKETVTRNIIASENIAIDIEAFFNISGEINQNQFEQFTSGLFKHYPFIQSAQYGSLLLAETVSTEAENVRGQLKPVLESYRPGLPLETYKETISDEDYLTAINSVLSGSEFSIAAPKIHVDDRYFWLYRLFEIKNEDINESLDGNNKRYGLLSILIKSEDLFEQTLLQSDISVSIFSESTGLSGRQLIYSNQSNGQKEQDSWQLAALKDEHSFQLPSYSIKFKFGKKLYWKDIDQAMLVASLIIGIGVTLLSISLVRAREIQARELHERNIVIQQQVDEQTKELAEARDEALEATRIKSDFLASMSHEIRTPLNAIIGMSELLSETPLNTEQNKYINIFRKAGDTLLSLVNDILDLSKIEAQQLILEEIPFNLREMVEESVDIYAVKASEKNIELIARIEPGTKIHRLGDPTRLRQIIMNLISNAMKFTEQGEILVTVKASGENKDELIISVADTGIGIPKTKLDAIFSSFTQVDSSTSRKYGGTGLGLTISKSLVHMMNGKIWVESEEGEGSTFLFTVQLPSVEASPTMANKIQNVDLTGQRILIVDDNSTNRLILKETLSSFGAETVEAADGFSALKILESGDDNFSFCMIDYRMPKMDGLDLAEQMKTKGIDLQNIFMISSSDFGKDLGKAKGLELGAYLSKPLKRAELLKQISISLHGEDVIDEVVKQDESESISSENKSILLVDDNPDNRLLVKAYLKKSPYKIDEAENGKEALSKFTANGYDLVFMDVQMPIMDGHEATRQIRAWEAKENRENTPIIALTAHAIKEEIDKCIAAGCDTHLGKPIKKATLLSTIENYLHTG